MPPSWERLTAAERADLLARVLWIGGAQWAGKSTVAQMLAARHGLILYAYDYHDARSHAERARRQPERFPHNHRWLAELERDPNSVWLAPTPQQMADAALLAFAERFAMVLDDLAALPSCATILAEGWGLRPSLLAPLLPAPERAVFLVPSEAFRQQQLAALPRAGALSVPGLSDPERAQRQRVERDRLLAQDVEQSAQTLGLPLIVVDGGQSAAEVAAEVEQQFLPFLPRWIY